MQLLISSLKANPQALLSTMKVESDWVLVNQCDKTCEEELNINGYTGICHNRNERGVGLSRNLCIDCADADIILFADEDIRYDKGYADLVEKEYAAHPEADVILFNVRVCPERQTYWNEGFEKVGRFGCGRFPAYAISCKRKRLIDSGCRFSPLFGGGAKYSNGEDSLFLTDMIKAGLAVYKTDTCLGEEEARQSTWFEGYTEKFFFDRGVLFYYLYGGLLKYLFAIRFLTKSEMYTGDIKRGQAFKLLCKGIKAGRQEKKKKV